MEIESSMNESVSQISEWTELINSVSTWVHSQLERTNRINWWSLSDEVNAFIQIAKQVWILDKIHATNFYHTTPHYLQANILQEWFHNQNRIFSGEQEQFLRSILKKIPSHKAPWYNIDSYIFWINDSEDQDNEKRWIYLSAQKNLSDYYPIPESIRFYFSILSESFDILDINEKMKAREYFIDFHKKLSQWTDTWEINIKNPVLYPYFLSGLRNAYEHDKEMFIEICKESPIIEGVNYKINDKIPPVYVTVIDTKKLKPIPMWTGRCKRLIEEIWLQ